MLEEIYLKRDPRRHVGQERVGDTMDCCLTWLCNLSGSSCRIAQKVNGYAALCSLRSIHCRFIHFFLLSASIHSRQAEHTATHSRVLFSLVRTNLHFVGSSGAFVGGWRDCGLFHRSGVDCEVGAAGGIAAEMCQLIV